MIVQDVDAAMLVERTGNELLDRRVVGDIGGDGLGTAARRADVRSRCLAGGLIPVGDDDHRAFPGHDHGAGAADAGTGACHHGDAVFEDHDAAFSLTCLRWRNCHWASTTSSDGGDEHDRRDGIDFRRHAAPDRGEDIDRQRRLRAGDEEGDDEIVEGEGEGEQKARDDRPA